MYFAGWVLFVLGAAFATSYAAKPISTGDEPAKLHRWFEEAGAPFGAALAVMSAGALLVRRKRHQPGQKASPTEGTASDGLADIARAFEALPEPTPSNADALHHALDRILEQQIPEFLECRNALIDKLGLLAFAQLMSPFASFERNLARAWSALIDESYEEVRASLDLADRALKEALAHLPPASTAS
jgi:hypothetical protein